MHFAGSNKSNFICLFRCRKNYLSFLLVTHNINTMCTYCFRQNGMNCCASIGTVWQLEIAWFRHGFLDSIIGKDIVIILKFCYPVGNGDISWKLSIVSSVWFIKKNTPIILSKHIVPIPSGCYLWFNMCYSDTFVLNVLKSLYIAWS